MSETCEHPFCNRSIFGKCSNHCPLDLCEEHLTEHQNLFLVQYEKSFNNLKKSFQGLVESFEEAKKRVDLNYQKKISLVNDELNSPSNEIEQQSLLVLSTQNLIKKKSQLLSDVKNGQALLYQYDIEQMKLYRTIIGNYQPTEPEILPASPTSASLVLSSPSSKSNFQPGSDNNEDEEEEDDNEDANDKDYYHKTSRNEKRNNIMNYYGRCPLTRLGVYGLQQKHNLVLCSAENRKSKYRLMTHLYDFHHIKWLVACELVDAIMKQANPFQTCVFRSNMNIIDKRFYVRYCPLKGMNLSTCRKKFFKDSLKEHLLNVHHLSPETTKRIVQTIENNGHLTALDFDQNEFK